MDTEKRRGRPPKGTEKVASQPAGVRRGLEDLGLSPSEARVLLALFKLGSANSTQLASESTVPRTAVYPVLESLVAKRVVERLGGDGPAVWATVGREEVFARLQAVLEADQDERLRQHHERAREVKTMLASALPETPQADLPYVHLLRGANQVKSVYDLLLTEAAYELMMFTRPPYAYTLGKPNSAVTTMLARGVRARVLYQVEQWNDPAAQSFRAEMDIYHRAGVEARLVDELPLKLIIVDSKVVLMGMAHPQLAEAGYPTFLHIEHPGAAAVMADAFERRWETGVAVPDEGQDQNESARSAEVLDLRRERISPQRPRSRNESGERAGS